MILLIYKWLRCAHLSVMGLTDGARHEAIRVEMLQHMVPQKGQPLSVMLLSAAGLAHACGCRQNIYKSDRAKSRPYRSGAVRVRVS
jgi:hypothetical protein